MLNKALMCNLLLHKHPCFWSTLGVNATDVSHTSTARGGEQKKNHYSIWISISVGFHANAWKRMLLLTVTARTHSLDDETRMQFIEQAEPELEQRQRMIHIWRIKEPLCIEASLNADTCFPPHQNNHPFHFMLFCPWVQYGHTASLRLFRELMANQMITWKIAIEWYPLWQTKRKLFS